MDERDFDVVVFGATGITGRQVAAYLAERSAETGARWAAAARDPGKLEGVLGEAGIGSAETIVADRDDPDSLAAMATRARVVLSLVGPYSLHGLPVIEACIGAGAHYADLSGEIPFVRRVIDACDARARDAGVKLVQVCGFEAMPPDLAVLLGAEAARERWGESLAEADLEVTLQRPPGLPRPSDLLSGGTLQSLPAGAGGEDAAVWVDPAALITDPKLAEAVRRRSPISVAPRRGPRGAVIAPLAPAAFINPAVIQRTAAMFAAEAGAPGEPPRYREGIAMRGSVASLPLRYATAGAASGMQAAFGAIAKTRTPVRRRVTGALGKLLPSSGFGPTSDRQEEWRWGMSLAARTTGGNEVSVEIDAEGHPGYLATARMLGEAGLLLADPELTPDRAGCLTPAMALGTEHLDRFEHAGVRFSVEG